MLLKTHIVFGKFCDIQTYLHHTQTIPPTQFEWSQHGSTSKPWHVVRSFDKLWPPIIMAWFSVRGPRLAPGYVRGLVSHLLIIWWCFMQKITRLGVKWSQTKISFSVVVGTKASTLAYFGRKILYFTWATPFQTHMTTLSPPRHPYHGKIVRENHMRDLPELIPILEWN